jgi:Nickel responsive protein SCO4226-like
MVVVVVTARSVFLVERFVPAGGSDEAAATRAERLAATLDRPDAPVRYLWSVRVPSDETWWCCFEAPDAATVADLNRRAGFPFDRISTAEFVPIAAPSAPTPQED